MASGQGRRERRPQQGTRRDGGRGRIRAGVGDECHRAWPGGTWVWPSLFLTHTLWAATGCRAPLGTTGCRRGRPPWRPCPPYRPAGPARPRMARGPPGSAPWGVRTRSRVSAAGQGPSPSAARGAAQTSRSMPRSRCAPRDSQTPARSCEGHPAVLAPAPARSAGDPRSGPSRAPPKAAPAGDADGRGAGASPGYLAAGAAARAQLAPSSRSAARAPGARLRPRGLRTGSGRRRAPCCRPAAAARSASRRPAAAAERGPAGREEPVPLRPSVSGPAGQLPGGVPAPGPAGPRGSWLWAAESPRAGRGSSRWARAPRACGPAAH